MAFTLVAADLVVSSPSTPLLVRTTITCLPSDLAALRTLQSGASNGVTLTDQLSQTAITTIQDATSGGDGRP